MSVYISFPWATICWRPGILTWAWVCKLQDDYTCALLNRVLTLVSTKNSLSFPWDIWKFQSYFEPFIQISKGNSLPKEVSWRNIHEKFCYSNESYGLLTPLTASLSSTFWLTASFKCSLHIYQVIHKWLFDCNLKNRGLHWMTTMFCMSPMLKWTWA